MRAIIINIAAFQLTWFACAWGAASGMPWPGVAAAAVAVAASVIPAPDRQARLILIACAGIIGIVAESTLAASGLVDYRAPAPAIGLAPIWIVALWLAFATLFPVSLPWLQHRLRLAALLGAIFAPLAYYAGGELDALSLKPPVWQPLAAIAVVWALATPALAWIRSRF